MSSENITNNELSSSEENNEEENNEEENNEEENNFYFSNYYIENNIETINASEILNNLNNNFYNYHTNNSFFSVLDNSDLLARIFMNSLIQNLEDQLVEEIMETSLNESKTLEKTDDFINFEKQKYNSDDEFMKKHIDCSICLNEFSNENDVSITNCKHIFHNDCIVEWTKYKKDCPICREDLSKE